MNYFDSVCVCSIDSTFMRLPQAGSLRDRWFLVGFSEFGFVCESQNRNNVGSRLAVVLSSDNLNQF